MIKYSAKASLMALSIGVASMLSYSSIAQAQGAPDLSFRPVSTTWTVSTKAIEVAKAQTQNCSISNTFNNGFIMSVNGSHKWVENISIDLKQKALETGKTYDVSLSVPGVKKALVPGYSDNGNLIIADLRGQKELYKAMRDTAVLDVDIEGNEFRFYMVNFAPASGQFERCMAGGDIKPIKTIKTEPLQAAISQDPFASITANESIALEDAEAKAIALTQIDPNDPKPIAKRIPYKETKKLGDDILSEKIVSANEVSKKANDTIVETTVKPVQAVAVEPLDQPEDDTAELFADKRTLAENAVQLKKPEKRQRFTEKLATQIRENPQIAAIDDDLETKDAVTNPTKLDVETAPAAKTIKVPAPKETNIRKPLAIPAVIKNIPLDDSVKEEAPAETVAVELPKPGALTAEDLNRQQLEKIKTGTIKKAKPVQPVEIKSAKVDLVDANVTPLSASVETNDPNAPFSKPLKPVTSLSDPSVKDKIEISTTPVADTKAVEVDEVVALPPADKKEDSLLPLNAGDEAAAPKAPKITKTNIRTPRIVNKVRNKRIEADFTDADNLEVANAASAREPYAGASPNVSRKISQLERKINGLEQENLALKDELDTSLEEGRQERLTISSENWNLERATQRYNEAERQLKNFGQQLQRERAQCNVEKKELEALLFDPEVTNEAQLARLADLERKLIAAEKKLKTYEGGL